MEQKNYKLGSYAYDDIYIYVPSAKQIIRIAEGDGMNLLEEDIANGYVDYIYYDIHDLDVGLPEIDGGQVMLTELFRDKYKTTKECVQDVFDLAYGVRGIPYIILT